MIKSLSFIVLTHFFQFNELKIARQPGYFKLNQQIFFPNMLNMEARSFRQLNNLIYRGTLKH